MHGSNSEKEGTGADAPPQTASPARRREPGVACRLNAQGRSVWSWRRDHPSFEAEPYEVAAQAEAAGSLAVLNPGASEEEWLAFELAVALFGRSGGYVDLDVARARLGPDSARRLVARAAAICARRGVGLLVETRRPAAACVLSRQCGPRPPCLRMNGAATALAPPARIG